MLLGYDEYNHLNMYKELDEKLILYNNGKKYGQVVFLAGGAGSGKGFAISNFMEGEKFKVFDVDELKKAFIKLKDLKMDLRNSQDVFDLHMMVKKSEIKNRILSTLFRSMKVTKAGAKGTLPNLLFDVTLKEIEDIDEVMPLLMNAGYKPTDLHITWVLTDYYVAVQSNQERARVVPDDILLQTHIGAAKTMYDMLIGKTPRQINGGIYVILNNKENTIPYVDADGKVIKSTGASTMTVKDFTYATLKKPKKRPLGDRYLKRQVYNWIVDNVPKDALRNLTTPKEAE